METLSRIWKKIEKLIFVDEFCHKYENPNAKVIFVLYCVSGGFCFDSHVRSNFRKAWIGLHIFNIILVYSFFSIYLFNAPIQDYYGALYPVPLTGGLLTKFGCFIWVFFTKDTFSKFFDFLNRKNHTMASNTRLTRRLPEAKMENDVAFGSTTDSNRYKSIFIGTLCVNAILIISMAMINVEEYIKFDDYVNYLYPIYVPYDKTPLVRFTIRLLQNVTMMPEIIVFGTFYTLISVIAYEIYDSFVRLGMCLRDTSESFIQVIDQVTLLETAMQEKRIPSSLSKIQELKIKRALAVDEFETKLICVIKQHQELISMAKLYSEKIQPIISFIHSEHYMILIILVFLISSNMIEMRQFSHSLPSIGIIFVVMSITLLLCFIGEIFEKMNELVAWQVYNIPWYLLQPKDRRVIHTFQIILTKPMKIFVFKLYPLNLSVFPGFLNTVYSQVQILRTLQLNKQKRHN